MKPHYKIDDASYVTNIVLDELITQIGKIRDEYKEKGEDLITAETIRKNVAVRATLLCNSTHRILKDPLIGSDGVSYDSSHYGFYNPWAYGKLGGDIQNKTLQEILDVLGFL